MNFVTYIKGAVRPGGTPSRYLVWVSVVLIAQALGSILPSAQFASPFNASHWILIITVALATIVHVLRKDNHKIIAAYFLYIVGLVLSTVTISMGITSLSGIIFMLTWAMTLFVAERREYISFDLVTIFMVLMLISTVILLLFQPALDVAYNGIILGIGAVLTTIDIYLVYIDFGVEKNFYQESRKTYTNLEILSSQLSTILSSEGELDHLLWRVTQECVPFLELEECVIYLYNPEKEKLVQVAAYGEKAPEGQQIHQPLDIEPGHGIVGNCFSQEKFVLANETGRHPDYIVDDQQRNSELAVPIFSNGMVIGVIDSEHSVKGFFKERHIQAFKIIASFCGIKITEYNAKEAIQDAQIAKNEAIRYKELDELKNRFITNISHDLKTPLSLIKAPAMHIAQSTDNESIKKQSNYILKNTEHLLRVVNQLLQLNRVDQGLNQLYMEEVEVRQMFQKVAGQYTGLVEKENVSFEVEAVSLRLITDSFRLEQIIHNLVHNAFRYTREGGQVLLSAKEDGELLTVTVSDNGPGIPVELQPKIFDRFVKADVNNHEGTGIGLSLVQEYVHSLQGTIDFKSSSDSGTTFIVKIPIHKPEDVLEKQDLPVGQDSAETGKPVMLVVEDHADLNDFICSFFESDFLCISAFDGEEALQRIEQQTPDIVISDLMMPKMDGVEFVETIKSSEQWGHIPIIVLSAKTQTQSRIDLYSTGADNYLTKPFDIQELSAVVKNVLEQRSKVKELFRNKFILAEQTPVEDKFSDEEEDDSALLEYAMKYVISNLDDSRLNVKDMAEHLGIGRNRLQKEIKALTELTPVELIRSIRLNKAKEFLADSTKTVSEVAYLVGFNNLSYFTRSFKAEFGILPSEVKETALKK